MNQMNVGQRIKKKRESQNLSLQYVADKLDINRSSVMRWENGETSRIKLPMLERLAQILHTTPEYLMGYEADDPVFSLENGMMPEEACMIPVWESLPLPKSSCREQTAVDYEITTLTQRQNCFFLHVSDDSMAPRLEKGDRVLVHRQKTLSNDDLGLFLLDGKQHIIRLYRNEKTLELKSFNPYFPTLTLQGTEVRRIKIIGRITESRRHW